MNLFEPIEKESQSLIICQDFTHTVEKYSVGSKNTHIQFVKQFSQKKRRIASAIWILLHIPHIFRVPIFHFYYLSGCARYASGWFFHGIMLIWLAKYYSRSEIKCFMPVSGFENCLAANWTTILNKLLFFSTLAASSIRLFSIM